MRRVLLIAGLLAAFSPAPAHAAENTVTIATWNLRGILPDLVHGRLAQRKSVWRHTFGPRQKAQRPTRLQPTVFEADIVALQGISSPALAKRLFPARKYLLIVGRRPAHVGSLPAGMSRPDARLTAIAVRRARHVRVIGRESIQAIAYAGAGANPKRTRVAGIAVKVRLGDRAVWVLSVDLVEGCRRGHEVGNNHATACTVQNEQFKVLAEWFKKKREGQEAAFVAGALNRDFSFAAANLERDHVRLNQSDV